MDRIADSHVFGSPQNKRGGKDDRVFVRCTLFEHGLRVADKATVRSDVFGFEDVIPVREMRLSFPSGVPRYELTLSHDIDAPWSTFEYWFPEWSIPVPDFEIPEIFGCDPFDEFDRIVETVLVPDGAAPFAVDIGSSRAGAWSATAESGGFWGVTGTVEVDGDALRTDLSASGQFELTSPAFEIPDLYEWEIGFSFSRAPGPSDEVSMDFILNGSGGSPGQVHFELHQNQYDPYWQVNTELVSRSFSSGVLYRAKFQYDRVNSIIKAKLWAATSSEPDWETSQSGSVTGPVQFIGILQNETEHEGTGLWGWRVYWIDDNLDSCFGSSSQTVDTPPKGLFCEVLTADSAPPGHDPADHYFRAATNFVPGTTKVTLEGLLLRPGVDYAEGDAYYGGYIQIDSTVDVTGKTVYMCYRADPELGNVVIV